MRITLLFIISYMLIAGVSCSKDKQISDPIQQEKHVLPGAGLKELVKIIRPDFLFGSFADGLISPDEKSLYRDKENAGRESSGD